MLLSVNVDHVATLRQARGTRYPDPVRAAMLCELAGADGITVHLREDRRHIQDRDVIALRDVCETRLNLEMAATDEMLAIAKRVRPDLVTLVPERREEQTTEGGLDVRSSKERLKRFVEALGEASVPVSFFIDPEEAQIDASAQCGAKAIELHTGDYAHAPSALSALVAAAAHAAQYPGLALAAGHGLTLRNVGPLIAQVPAIEELNIGHALIGDAIFLGLEGAVRAYRAAIAAAKSPSP